MSDRVRVLLVDDSPTARQLLASIINDAPDLELVGEAADGNDAVAQAQALEPDIILMDIVMPRMDGLEATREIMYVKPTPIVLVSASFNVNETDVGFRAINAGALTLQSKPAGINEPSHRSDAAQLVSTLRTMAGVRVIHHWKRYREEEKAAPEPLNKKVLAEVKTKQHPEIVGIVASTGGPAALREIVSNLPADFELPLVIVQHIAPDFVRSLSQWLPHVTRLPVCIAAEGATPVPGTIYLAPGGVHLKLSRQKKFVFCTEPSDVAHIPAGDVLLSSIAESYGGAAVGVVLTGMGSDGARGLLQMHQAGAMTIAQDEDSSVVYGMPREAAAYGAARQILPLEKIPQVLSYLATKEVTVDE